MKKNITSKQTAFIASSVAIILLLPACSNAVSTKPDTVLPKQSTFFEHFDANKDQIVTVDEFIAARSDRFKADDKNDDGVLSRREYITASHVRQKARKEQQRLERRKKYFAEMDTDNDGTVDENEFMASSQARAKKSFSKMDKDNSGIINSGEYASYRYQGSQDSMSRRSPYQMFKEMDINKDSQISQSERNTARMKWFDSMDINGNKLVTPEEVELAREERAKKKALQKK